MPPEVPPVTGQTREDVEALRATLRNAAQGFWFLDAEVKETHQRLENWPREDFAIL